MSQGHHHNLENQNFTQVRLFVSYRNNITANSKARGKNQKEKL
jgi:hypothetical protein